MSRGSNYLNSVIQVFGDITASYTNLIDLEKDITYNHQEVACSFDQPVILKYENVAIVEEELPANVYFTRDGFHHNGLIQIKAKSALPTVGFIKHTSFR